MKPKTKRQLAYLSGFATILGAAVMFPVGTAYAQSHGHEEISLTGQEVLGGISHGAFLASVVFLVGLAAFTALVWLPIS